MYPNSIISAYGQSLLDITKRLLTVVAPITYGGGVVFDADPADYTAQLI